MAEIDALGELTGGFELGVVEREATPEPLMTFSIQLHAARLSLSDTVSVLEGSGVDGCRTTLHNWMREADPQPGDGTSPTHVALDETVIQFDNDRFWLVAAVDPATDEFLPVGLHPACSQALTERFLRELREKHGVGNAVFLVDGAPWLQAALPRSASDVSTSPLDIETPSNESSKK